MQVSSLLNKFFALPYITQDNLGKLKELRDNLHFVMNSLNNVGCNTSTWDPKVVHSVLQKLSTTLRRDSENKQGEKTDYPTLSTFKAFLDSKINALAAIALDHPKTTSSEANIKTHVASKLNSNHSAKGNESNCSLCSQSHYIFACPKFSAMTGEERHKVCTDKHLCTNCLSPHHLVNDCLKNVCAREVW